MTIQLYPAARGPRLSRILRDLAIVGTGPPRDQVTLLRGADRFQEERSVPSLTTAPGPGRHARSAELAGQSPGVDIELVRDDGQQRTVAVTLGRLGDRIVAHLPGHAPPVDAGAIQVGDDRGPVHLVLTGERVDRPTLTVEVTHIADVGSREPALDRV